MNNELEELRNKLSKYLFSLCHKKMTKDETEYYCKVIDTDVPNLEYDYGYVYDDGNDYHTHMRLCFCIDNGLDVGRNNIKHSVYFNEIECVYPYIVYPLTEEEKHEKEREEEEKLKFKFGKYKGRKILDVYKENPNYITWCIKNIPGFKSKFKKLK